MGACWVAMAREKKELMNHEMHANDWGYNNSKTEQVALILDLITTLRKKSHDINQGEI